MSHLKLILPVIHTIENTRSSEPSSSNYKYFMLHFNRDDLAFVNIDTEYIDIE